MKKMNNRISHVLALVLTIALSLSLFVVPASADNSPALLEEGYYNIVSKNGFYLNVYGISGWERLSGVNICLYEGDYSNEQIAHLKKIAPGVYNIGFKTSELVLDIYKGNSWSDSVDPGDNVDLYHAIDPEAQDIEFIYVGNGYYKMRLAAYPSLVIAATGAYNKANVRLEEDTGASDQLWKLIPLEGQTLPSTTSTSTSSSTSSSSTTVATTGKSTFDLQMEELQTQYRDGEYWNYYSCSDYSETGTTPCHCTGSYCAGTCSCYCGSYYSNGVWLAGQCLGYCFQLAREIEGGNPYFDRTKIYTLSNVQPGDIIRYNWDSHAIFVTAVNGNTITYTDCNRVGPCEVQWGDTMKLSDIQGFSYISRNTEADPDDFEVTVTTTATVASVPTATSTSTSSNASELITLAEMMRPTWVNTASSTATQEVVSLLTQIQTSRTAFDKVSATGFDAIAALLQNSATNWVYFGASVVNDPVTLLSGMTIGLYCDIGAQLEVATAELKSFNTPITTEAQARGFIDALAEYYALKQCVNHIITPQLAEIAEAGTGGNLTYIVNTLSKNAAASALSLAEIDTLSTIYDGMVTAADLSDLTAALGIDNLLSNGREQIYAIFGSLL